MSELVVENGIVIDNVEEVLSGIANLSQKKISGAETFRKFITEEKNTKFYVNSKCLSSMVPDADTVYLWLDSGFTDSYGNPLLISLLRTEAGYCGHYYGTFDRLADAIRSYFPQNRREIDQNLSKLEIKYRKKIENRRVKHIQNENEYLVALCNGESGFGTSVKFLLDGLDLSRLAPDVQNQEEPEPEEVLAELPYDMNFREKEITIGLLLETIDGMQSYIDEILAELERSNTADRARIQELEAKNAEYKAALIGVRTFMEEEAARSESDEDRGNAGHLMLRNGGKILVLGATELDPKIMNGIAKTYGFMKKDLEYETDYAKVINYTERIRSDGRYVAIIFGAMPHKVKSLDGWSSFLEKCKNCEDMPRAYDARSRSGELKVTKESFRAALLELYKDLRMPLEV